MERWLSRSIMVANGLYMKNKPTDLMIKTK